MADYAEALSQKPKPRKAGPKELREIEVAKGEDGGHTAMHRFKQGDGPYHEPEGPHIFGASEGLKLVNHLVEHLGIKGVKVSAAGKED